jgi:NADH-quinone oxidoreductase subunit H
VDLIMPFLWGLGFLALVLTHTVVFIWCELKILAHVTDRLGPMTTGGFHGWLQPVADVMKLLNKEDVIPAGADRILFKAAPFIVFVPVFATLAALPLSDRIMARDFDPGVFYIMAFSGFSFVGMVVAGWSSNNKYSLLGALRAAGQLISYELPLGLAVAGVIMISGSLSLVRIVEAQTVPFLLIQPIGFLVFFIAMIAELGRTPFDLPMAESELVAGYFTEYSGMRWSLFFVGEYFALFTLSGVCAILFLGGWRGPFLPPPVWLLLKIYLLFTVLVMIRGTLPRVRPDQLMAFGWKVLVPATFVNLLLTAFFGVLVENFRLPLALTEFALLAVFLAATRRTAS